MSTINRFELWAIDERGTLSKPSDEGDNSEFQLSHSIKGWALIGCKEIVLFKDGQGRSGSSANSPLLYPQVPKASCNGWLRAYTIATNTHRGFTR
jgi:hypothetical protein